MSKNQEPRTKNQEPKLQYVYSVLHSWFAVLRLLRRGLALAIVAVPLSATSYVVLNLAGNLMPVVHVWLTKLVVDRLAVNVGVPGDMSKVIVLAVLAALALVIPSGLQWLMEPLLAWIESRTVAEVDRQLMQAGTRLVDLYRVERPAFQDELRLLQDVPYSLPRLFPALQTVLGTMVQLGGLLFLLGRLHPLLPLALALVAIPHLVAERRLQGLMWEAMERRSRAAREMDYYARLTTDPSVAKEVRVFGLGDFFLQRFRDRCAAALAGVSRARLAGLRISAIFGGMYTLALAGGFWYVATQAGAGRLTLGDMILYLNAVMQAQQRAMFLSIQFGVVYETLLRVRGLFNFLDRASSTITLTPSVQARPAPARLQEGVELRKISFRYPESTQAVLVDVNARLPAGKVTALVGMNGTGKSTLVKLLTRMYDPDSGEILLDGVPLAVYDLTSLRRQIAVVYQDFARFALTLRENIAVGNAEAGQTNNQVEVAARWAGADKIAVKLPQGYDTQLTRRFEGGVELSGGEWQKVALARGFVRDAALVILDEPTSALDADAEERLFERFRELVAGKTALLISHRFSTVRTADQILVIEDGRIIEAGSHADLIAKGGRYATLYELQAGRYREHTSDVADHC